MVDWVTVVASVSLSVVGSIVVTEYQLRRERSVEESVEVEEWYADAAGYAAQVRRTWQRLFDTPEHPGVNLQEIQGELSLLEGQISRHATNGEQLGADQEVIEALDELSNQCRRPGELPLHNNSGQEFAEYREDILAAVEDVETALENR